MNQKRILTVLFITLLLDVIGIGILIPVIPSLFTDATSNSFMLAGYSVSAQYFIAGLMTALFGLMQFLVAPLLGDLSDTYGRKRLLTLGVGVLAVAQLLFAAGIALFSLTLLFLSRIVAGIAGANFSIVQAAIADITEPKNRARNFGLIGAAFGLGFIIGPLVGGVIVSATGNPALPFIFAGCLGIINLISITLLLPETNLELSEAKKFSLGKAFTNIKVAYMDVDNRPLYTVSFLQMLGFGIYTSFSAVFLTYRFNFTEADTGSFFAVVGVCMVLSQLFVVRYASKYYSERQVLRFALPLLALVLFAQMAVYSVIVLYLLIPFTAVSIGLISTNIPALISKGVSNTRQGAALGINGSLQALSQGIAPLLASAVAAVTAIPFIYAVAGGLVVLAFTLFPKHNR